LNVPTENSNIHNVSAEFTQTQTHTHTRAHARRRTQVRAPLCAYGSNSETVQKLYVL